VLFVSLLNWKGFTDVRRGGPEEIFFFLDKRLDRPFH
jgi:hypothetical protein